MTSEQEGIVRRLLWQTWEYIGNDIMQVLQEEGKYSLSRNSVIEAVLDADYMDSTVRKDSEREALKVFKQLSYKDRIKFSKTVFKSERYS